MNTCMYKPTPQNETKLPPGSCCRYSFGFSFFLHFKLIINFMEKDDTQ